MFSLFGQARNITLADAHTLLNKVQGVNTQGSLEQDLRDIQAARESLEGQFAVEQYNLRTLQGNLAAHQAADAKMVSNIQLLMNSNGGQPTADSAAAAKKLAVALGVLRAGHDAEVAGIAAQQAKVDQLDAAVDGVNQKEATKKAEFAEMMTEKATSSAMDKTTKALTSADAAMNGMGAMDSMKEQIGRENAKSTAAFDRAMGSMADPSTHAVADVEADALLASIMTKAAA